jgi:hypothetical protein
MLSPGRGEGAAAGVPGSGVLLEGWLRQKQRRGVRGLKIWHSRYFVLYTKTNEIRYYSDVVQSGWGPIPINELGSIALRSIQRISKPSHPKYKGCRFDITAKTTAGGLSSDDGSNNNHSSDEENAVSQSNSKQTHVNAKQSAAAAKPQQESNTTPKASASRVYSLVADSPQVRQTGKVVA